MFQDALSQAGNPGSSVICLARGPSPTVYLFTLDTSRMPAAYDLAHLGTSTPRFLGIYKVEGDILTRCYRSAEQGRPTTFGTPGRGITEVYKRLKP